MELSKVHNMQNKQDEILRGMLNAVMISSSSQEENRTVKNN